MIHIEYKLKNVFNKRDFKLIYALKAVRIGIHIYLTSAINATPN